MNDVISRQAAIAHFKKRLMETAINNVGVKENADRVYSEMADCRVDIWMNEIPSAQPERKPKPGKWINYDSKYRLATCSKCNKITMFELWGTKVKFYDFCPNCGADMRGEQDE